MRYSKAVFTVSLMNGTHRGPDCLYLVQWKPNLHRLHLQPTLKHQLAPVIPYCLKEEQHGAVLLFWKTRYD